MFRFPEIFPHFSWPSSGIMADVYGNARAPEAEEAFEEGLVRRDDDGGPARKNQTGRGKVPTSERKARSLPGEPHESAH